MDIYERLWFRANRWWRKYVTKPVKQLFCRHGEIAYHYRAFKYDSNPPHNAIRWAIERRSICPRCGKHYDCWELIREDLKKRKAKELMQKLQRIK